MKYKRIAVISYHTCPFAEGECTDVGGMNVYVLELSKELAKKGYLVDIFTRFVSKKSSEIVVISPSLRVIHLKAGKQKKIAKTKLTQYIPEFLNNFYKFTDGKKLNYDLVSCHYYLSGIIGLEIKKKLKVFLIVTFHTLALMKNLVARGEEGKEDFKRIKAEIILTQKADKIIATSEADAKYLNALYNCPIEKITILTPGVNLDLFKPISKKKAKKIINADFDYKLILFVGRIVPLKGIDVIFYALKILLEKNPGLHLCLWIVGQKSRELERLEEMRKLLKITTLVRFVGRKRQNELPYYYNASEIVIMPSQYESFGIIALEAMACGAPVITTDVAGVANLFDKNLASLITSASNPIFLAQKIENLLSDKKEYAKLSREVFEKVQDLSWENAANKFIKIIKSAN